MPNANPSIGLLKKVPVIAAEYVNTGAIAVTSIASSGASTINVLLGTDAGDDFTIDGVTFVVEGDNNRIGIGTSTPSASIDIVGGGISAKGAMNEQANYLQNYGPV